MGHKREPLPPDKMTGMSGFEFILKGLLKAFDQTGV
jgi:hypothetical protein